MWRSALVLAAALGVALCARGGRSTCSGSGVVSLKGQGDVRGTCPTGRYWQFKGIPYANASQEYRFQYPLPVPSWEGVREADADVACVQIGLTGTVVGTEDCLVMNVYTPSDCSTGPRAVMVFIHGGGFDAGSAEKIVYGPDMFIEKDVLLVTFNYRLGLLGFLCSGGVANNGLKDGITALEWIRDNIAAFGGDPQRVTIFGESSGSVYVEHLVHSDRAKGLFAGAICQSGTANSPWAIGSDPEVKARRVAEELGYYGDDVATRMGIFKNASLEDITTATANLVLKTPQEFLAIAPCIEPPSADAVLTRDPIVSIEQGLYNDIPLILGFNRDEGLLIYGAIATFPNYFEMLDKDFLYTLPMEFQNLTTTADIINATREFYFQNETPTIDNIEKSVVYASDTNYVYKALQTVRRYAASGKTTPTFLYEFSYDGGMPYYKILLNITNIPGTSHADEIAYMFSASGFELTLEEDLLVSDRLVTLWSNFAKYGNPTPTTTTLIPTIWQPSTQNLEYYLIDEGLHALVKPFPNRTDFWDGIYEKYYT